MVAESLRLIVTPRVEGLSVTGWAARWSDYVSGDRGVAELLGLAAKLSQAPPLVVLTEQLARAGTRTIAIGEPYSAQHVWRAREAGVAAWIEVTASVDQITEALTAAQQEKPYFSTRIQALLDAEPARAVPPLGTRELEVVDAYVNAGLGSMDLVSSRLGLGAPTVRSHIAAVRRRYRALNVALPTKLALRARLIDDGWVQPAARSVEVR